MCLELSLFVLICLVMWVVVKSGYLFVSLKNTAPNIWGIYPKRDPNFDNHPCVFMFYSPSNVSYLRRKVLRRSRCGSSPSAALSSRDSRFIVNSRELASFWFSNRSKYLFLVSRALVILQIPPDRGELFGMPATTLQALGKIRGLPVVVMVAVVWWLLSSQWSSWWWWCWWS